MKLWIVAAVLLARVGSLSAQAPPPAWLVGRWSAPPFELPLSSDFHRSVYGPGARSVRQVTLTIRPGGDGTFTVTNSVRDRSGKTVPGTREIDELTFTIGDLAHEPGYQPRYTSRIEKAERRYPDDPKSSSPLPGAKLELFVPEGESRALDVRFDTPEGPGSFGERLHPVAKPTVPHAR